MRVFLLHLHTELPTDVRNHALRSSPPPASGGAGMLGAWDPVGGTSPGFFGRGRIPQGSHFLFPASEWPIKVSNTRKNVRVAAPGIITQASAVELLYRPCWLPESVGARTKGRSANERSENERSKTFSKITRKRYDCTGRVLSTTLKVTGQTPLGASRRRIALIPGALRPGTRFRKQAAFG